MSRKYDIVQFGATGTAGIYAAQHLSENGPSTLKWAIAGRSVDKLNKIVTSLKGIKPDVITVDVVKSEDKSKIIDIVKSTRLIITTVGPFALYGTSLFSACARNGTHYVDLSGEFVWLSEMIQQHETEAEKSGAIMIPFCGIDSIPSDIGTWKAVQTLQKTGCKAATTAGVWPIFQGVVSGATLQSFITTFGAGPEKFAAGDAPYSCSPIEGTTIFANRAVSFNSDFQLYTRPFVFEHTNNKIVYRSWGLRKQLNLAPYGDEFEFTESHGDKTWWTAIKGFTLGLALILPMMLGPTRNFMSKYVLPQSGQGAPKDPKDGGFVNCVIAKSTDGSTDQIGYAEVYGRGDPGYGLSGMMISECALALLFDGDKLEHQKNNLKGGIFTTSTALGDALISRLDKHGIHVVTRLIDKGESLNYRTELP